MKQVLALCALLCALLATVVFPTAASAQCRLCETPTTVAPLPQGQSEGMVLEVTTALDFDEIIVVGLGTGAAELGPDGSRSMEGAVTAISSRAMVGDVTVRGDPGRRIDVSLPARIELHATDGSRIALSEIEADLPAAPRLNEQGELRFRFGGRLEVDGGLEGDFRGDLTISVDYL